MTQRIILNAGHFQDTTGVIVDGKIERDINIEIRDELREIYRDDDHVEFIADDLSLRESIDKVNLFAKPEDIAVSIHINGSNDIQARGVSVYYDKDKKLAELFSKKVSKSMEIPNRGAISDTKSYYGELGWLRQTNCKSVLVECGFLSNALDRHRLLNEGGIKLAAKGISDAINEVRFGKDIKEYDAVIKLLDVIKVIISRIIDLLTGRV